MPVTNLQMGKYHCIDLKINLPIHKDWGSR